LRLNRAILGELARETTTGREARELSAIWLAVASEHQVPPPGDWRTWLFMGGRGAGKTRAGAEWVRGEVAAGRARRIALVGPTLGDVREVMIEGPSGLRSIAPDEERPIYSVSRRRLVWPNGAEGFVFSAEDADSLRGPQFDAAWCDEISAWPKGQSVWDMLSFALRLSAHPRAAATTTPRPEPLVRRLVEQAMAGRAGVVMTRATTRDNADNLAPGFVAALEANYAGTHLLRQELEGELLDGVEGALFTREIIEDGRVRLEDVGGGRPPVFERVVVAVDPPASVGETADACGIIAAGRRGDTVYVLADASVRGLKPLDWAGRALALARAWGAGEIVAESNQGGEMVRSVLEIAGATPRAGVRVKLLHAKKSKRDRAAPVSALYQRREVRHAGVFRELEDEMLAFGAEGAKSPDRVDALVWAVMELKEKPTRAGVILL
jgi:phage terminase large subunit-like protein